MVRDLTVGMNQCVGMSQCMGVNRLCHMVVYVMGMLRLARRLEPSRELVEWHHIRVGNRLVLILLEGS